VFSYHTSVCVQWAASKTSKRKKKVSAAKRTAKRSRVHVDDSDKASDKASEPEEGQLCLMTSFIQPAV